MTPAPDAATRLIRLARTDQYNGPRDQREVEMIRNWVLHGQRVLDREVIRT